MRKPRPSRLPARSTVIGVAISNCCRARAAVCIPHWSARNSVRSRRLLVADDCHAQSDDMCVPCKCNQLCMRGGTPARRQCPLRCPLGDAPTRLACATEGVRVRKGLPQEANELADLKPVLCMPSATDDSRLREDAVRGRLLRAGIEALEFKPQANRGNEDDASSWTEDPRRMPCPEISRDAFVGERGISA